MTGRTVEAHRSSTTEHDVRATRRCRDPRKEFALKTTLLFLLAGAGVGLGWQSSAQAIESARWGAVSGALTAQIGQTKMIEGRGEVRRDHVVHLMENSRAA